MGRCVCIVFALSAYLCADSNLRITDVGLHGYRGTPCAVRLVVRNPSSHEQSVHLRVAAADGWTGTDTVSSDVSLNGGEERQLELPLLISAGGTKITADAAAEGSAVGHDVYAKVLWSNGLVVLMCTSENVCKSAQSQIEFSGNITERADKNRNLKFEVVYDAREDWWAYSPASAVVLAMPLAKFTTAQRNALEGYLRRGGRLVLVEDEIAERDFLSAYRKSPPAASGERVGKGTLFRVSRLSANELGNTFIGLNLPAFLQGQTTFSWPGQRNFLLNRFGTTFHFPRLRWMLIWLAAYILIIGVLNFAVLRRWHRLEFGWLSMCGLALLFAAGFYFSSASRRPREFRLDNLATYYLDARSPRAAADYALRISAPKRRNLVVSVADAAVFAYSNFNEAEPNGQIWTQMNGKVGGQYEIYLGPPRQVELSLLKWSFRDLNMEGLREFPGTVHFVGLNRLRNDTDQHFVEAVYLDYGGNALYALPALAPGDEIQLDTIIPKPIHIKEERQVWNPATLDQSKGTLEEFALAGFLPSTSDGRVFAGFSDGPALPVELNISHQESPHSLIIVALEQP